MSVQPARFSRESLIGIALAVLAGFLSLFLGGGSIPVGAQESPAEPFWGQIDRDIAAIDEFTNFANRSDTTDDEVVHAADALIQQLELATRFYEQHPSMGSYSAATTRIVNGIVTYLSGLKQYRQAFATADSALSKRALTIMNNGISEINAGVERARQIDESRVEAGLAEARQTEGLLRAGTGIAFAVLLLLFYRARRQPMDPIGRSRSDAYMGMARSALVVFAGLLITLATWTAAAEGGTYIVAYGAIVFGGLALLGRAITYFVRDKPQLDMLQSMVQFDTVLQPVIAGPATSMSKRRRGFLGWVALVITGLFILNLVSRGATSLLRSTDPDLAVHAIKTATSGNIGGDSAAEPSIPPSKNFNRAASKTPAYDYLEEAGIDPSYQPSAGEGYFSQPGYLDELPDPPTAFPLERLNCDPAYPEERTCIPPGPPLDQPCAITDERNFIVLPPDPRGLDLDGDGIGCEPITP